MRIAVNTRFLLPDYLEGYGYFIFETFRYLVNRYPSHQFIFIFDRPFDRRFIFSSNITAVVVGPPARHPLLWKYWYDIRVPGILKRYKADIFVAADGLCSLTTKIPQLIVVHDLAFLHYPAHIRKSHLLFFKRYVPKFLEKAKSIVTVSEYSKQDILLNYGISPDKVNVVYSAAKEIFKPIPGDIAENTKMKYTGGTEFFLYVGAVHPRKNLVNLLKAFSIFKKRQKSNLKLVLVGRLAWKYDSFIHNLKKYKYRQDVLLPGYLTEDELAKMMAAAYALVYPSLFEGFGVPVLEAMKCHVPVITSSNSAMEEIAGDAALYADPKSFEDLAEKMMLIYKDENLRNTLIEKGKIVSLRYSWPRTAELLWESIQKAVGD
jgi:glycosyltransferase involved in cell wall biosynthesis